MLTPRHSPQIGDQTASIPSAASESKDFADTDLFDLLANEHPGGALL